MPESLQAAIHEAEVVKEELDSKALDRLKKFYQFWADNHTDSVIRVKAADRLGDESNLISSINKYVGNMEAMYKILEKNYGPEPGGGCL